MYFNILLLRVTALLSVYDDGGSSPGHVDSAVTSPCHDGLAALFDESMYEQEAPTSSDELTHDDSRTSNVISRFGCSFSVSNPLPVQMMHKPSPKPWGHAVGTGNSLSTPRLACTSRESVGALDWAGGTRGTSAPRSAGTSGGSASAAVAVAVTEKTKLPLVIPSTMSTGGDTRLSNKANEQLHSIDTFLDFFGHCANLLHESSWSKQPDNLLFVGFNSINDGYTLGMNNSLRVLVPEPYINDLQTHLMDFKATVAHVYNKSELIAFVGSGRHPMFPQTHVFVWDAMHHCKQDISCESAVLMISLRFCRLVVVLAHKSVIYDTSNVRNGQITVYKDAPTFLNPTGLVCVSPYNSRPIIVLLGKTKGSIRIVDCDRSSRVLIQAHDADIAALTLSHDASLLSTASSKGTKIRVFNTTTAEVLWEFRRGVGAALVYSLSFNPSNSLLACSSSKKTIHVFGIGKAPTCKSDGLSSVLRIRDVKEKNICVFDMSLDCIHVILGKHRRRYDLERGEGVCTLKAGGYDSD